MDNGSPEPGSSNAVWKPGQTYAMAVLCLLIGLVIGYLVRGSAAPAPAVASAADTQPAPRAAMGQQAMPTLDQMQQMADKQAEPLLAKLKSNPNDAGLLNQIGTLYRATHQFKTAIAYYQQSLAIDPKNVGARTDMASCMFYLGDADGALAELDKSLSYDPKHAGTLMNIGIIKWKGKNDVPGAIAAWQQVLKLNPGAENKQMIQHMIEQAKKPRQDKDKAPMITGVTTSS